MSRPENAELCAKPELILDYSASFRQTQYVNAAIWALMGFFTLFSDAQHFFVDYLILISSAVNVAIMFFYWLYKCMEVTTVHFKRHGFFSHVIRRDEVKDIILTSDHFQIRSYTDEFSLKWSLMDIRTQEELLAFFQERSDKGEFTVRDLRKED
jgi:hypothetical protein